MAVTVEYAEGGLCRLAVDGEMTIYTALTLKRVDQLSVYLGGGANPRALVKAAQVPAEYERPHTTQGGGEVETDHWHLSLRFGADVLRNGMGPLSFVRYLATLGQIVQIVTLIDGIPGAASMDPESCHLGFEIGFKSQADKATIEGVFEFMRDDCRIRILPPHSKISEYLELLSDLPQEQDDLLGDMLVRCGTLTQNELETALRIQKVQSHMEGEASQPIGEVLVKQHMVHLPVVDAALEKQKQRKDSKAAEASLIRVDAANAVLEIPAAEMAPPPSFGAHIRAAS